jgi:predicted SAM-dependent methyltransferase
MRKLQVGCGPKKLPDYVNIDILEESEADVLANITILPFKDNSFDLLYSSSVIEHFGRSEWVKILIEWGRVIKPMGKIYISTPNFETCAQHYIETGNLEELVGLVMGGQKDEYDWHGMIYDFKTLERGLVEAGFEYVTYYDWRKFDVGVHNMDDFSQAYLPHMDKDNGKLMMLNLVATKIK